MKNSTRDLLGLPYPVGLFGFFLEKTCKVFQIWQIMFLFSCLCLVACQQNYTPKPHAYHRIDFPDKGYQLYDSICPFTFEYPVYGTLAPYTRPASEPCWFNINFPKYKGAIYLTYHKVDNFDLLIEDNWKMIYTVIAQMADDVRDEPHVIPEMKVFGMIYDIKGNAASAVQFYVTDSVKNFLRGGLYFATRPNHDSLAPAINFFREDIVHLIESIRWKDINTKK